MARRGRTVTLPAEAAQRFAQTKSGLYAVVAGLDLSLRCAGMIAVPSDWGGDFGRCTVATAGRSLRKDASEHERVSRLREIRDAVLHFVRRTGATMVVIEQYAFSAQSSQARALGELGGVVRVALVEEGIPIESIPVASARKLLGKQPRKGAKDWAVQRLVAMGAPRQWPADALDAFCVANAKLAELGVGLLAPEDAA